MALATPFDFNPEYDREGLPEAIPTHAECGLPEELCLCFEAQPAPGAATRIGETLAINLDVAGGEDEARRLMQEGWKVRVVSLQTSEVECPACGWGHDKTVFFDCPLGAGGEPPAFMQCPSCDHRIELSIELLNMMRRAYDGKI